MISLTRVRRIALLAAVGKEFFFFRPACLINPLITLPESRQSSPSSQAPEADSFQYSSTPLETAGERREKVTKVRVKDTARKRSRDRTRDRVRRSPLKRVGRTSLISDRGKDWKGK